MNNKKQKVQDLPLVGNAYMKPEVMIALIPSETKKLLYNDAWSLNLGAYESYQGQKLMKQIIEARISVLHLDYNQNPSIIKEIKDIGFPCLRKLELFCNKIQSFEGIQSLNAPMLKTFRIDFNHITSIRPLRKACFPQLVYLDLRDNPIISFADLSQLNTPLLQSLWTEGLWIPNFAPDVFGWTVKMNLRHIRQLGNMDITNGKDKFKKHVFQNRIISQIYKRHPTIRGISNKMQ